MEFKARTVTRNYLELLPGLLRYKGPKVLVEFVVSNITMGEGLYLNNFLYRYHSDRYLISYFKNTYLLF